MTSEESDVDRIAEVTGAPDEVDIATDVTATDKEAAANDAAERVPRIDRRAAARWGGKAVVGALCIAVAVVGVRAFDDTSWSTETAPGVAQVTPASPAQSRVCAGPPVRIGTADGTSSEQITSFDQPTPTLSATGVSAAELPLADDTAQGSATVVELADGSQGLAGAQSSDVDVEGARGFAASECTEPANMQWLVGGATTTGRSTTITIANAGDSNASVDISVFSEQGRATAAGSTGIAVAAGEQIVVDLAGLAPGLVSPVVRVASIGSPVSARLQSTVVRGLVPGGFDVTEAVPSASTDVVLPGVTIQQPVGIENTVGFEDATPTLRLLAGESGPVQIAIAADGQAPITSEVELQQGVVSDVSLGELGPGTYSVRLTSATPIVAAARETTIASDGRIDVEWTSAASVLPEATTLVVPEGPSPQLHIVNTTNAEQVATVDGQATPIAPGAELTVPISVGEHTLAGVGLAAAVSYSGEGQVGGFTVSPPGPGVDGITVVF